MNKYVVKGLKKLFSLTRTKIRLAEEHDTCETRPQPLPLVNLLAGVELRDVEGCRGYRDVLRDSVDLNDPGSVACSTLQLMDIIEGVKYLFEPAEFSSNINFRRFGLLEERAVGCAGGMRILIMTRGAPEGLNIYLGSNPPKGVVFLSAVPTSLAVLLNYLFGSGYFSEGLVLRNITSVLGQRTLINNVIHFSLGFYGAHTLDEDLG